MRIEITFPPEGPVVIKAVDLTGDAWDDFCYYLADAQQASTAADVPATNRALRSALISLFSHLEGVVSGLYSNLIQERNDFNPSKHANKRFPALINQINDLCAHAYQQFRVSVNPPLMHYKLLRDIVAHPSIIKTSRDSYTGEEIELSEVDVFDLTVEGLQSEGKLLDEWLNRVCSLYRYPRFHDTYLLCKDFTESLGHCSDHPREPRKV